ncbi:site-2 protease family protein, partial [candidate division WWE3 bacterium]|nr:site-2 protease family protein [candidate division WWE3 bacterium]
ALVYLNLILCFFNLLPIHPLDGFKVVWGLLPHELAFQWMDLAPYGMFALLFLVVTGYAAKFITLPVNYFLNILLG